MSINQAIEKLRTIPHKVPGNIGGAYTHALWTIEEVINDLKSIEKVTYSKILEAEFQSTKNAIKVVDEINLRIWGV